MQGRFEVMDGGEPRCAGQWPRGDHPWLPMPRCGGEWDPRGGFLPLPWARRRGGSGAGANCGEKRRRELGCGRKEVEEAHREQGWGGGGCMRLTGGAHPSVRFEGNGTDVRGGVVGLRVLACRHRTSSLLCLEQPRTGTAQRLLRRRSSGTAALHQCARDTPVWRDCPVPHRLER